MGGDAQMRAVCFERYGPVDVLDVVDVPPPTPSEGRAVVGVVATSINPGEIMIREGAFDEQAPARFPSGQGSDLAGRVTAVGPGVTALGVGDEVLGWTDERAAQAERVAVPADQLTARPAGVPWEQAGSLYVAGCTACGMVETAGVHSGETVMVAGATGGVGSIAIQLARQRDARVVGVAGAGNRDWLASMGVHPVGYGDGLEQRLRAAAPDGIDAALDCYGGGYVEQAIRLGVAAERIVTIADFAAAEKHAIKTVFGHQLASTGMLDELATMIQAGELTVPIAATYPLTEVRQAYTHLAERHTRGKIVLHPGN
jgi:NADPH:quinone reductase-like Zn-dependent oxidoreductase